MPNATLNFPNNKCNKCSFDKEVPNLGKTNFSKWIRLRVQCSGFEPMKLNFCMEKWEMRNYIQCTICKKQKTIFLALQNIFDNWPRMQTQSYEQHVLQLTTMKSVAQNSCNCWKSNLNSTTKKMTFYMAHGPKSKQIEIVNSMHTRKLLPFKMWWIESQSKATVSSIQYPLYSSIIKMAKCKVGHFYSSH